MTEGICFAGLDVHARKTAAAAVQLDDVIVHVLRGSGFIPLEQIIMHDNGAGRVIAMRHEFQRAIARPPHPGDRGADPAQSPRVPQPGNLEPDITIRRSCHAAVAMQHGSD